MTYNSNANSDRKALLQALSDIDADEQFSDIKLNELIETEFSKPVELIDSEVLDACYRLLERKHSPFSDKQIAKSEQTGLKQFRRFMKQKRVLNLNKREFWLKPCITAALIILLMIAPALITKKDFRVSMPLNEQQYLVVGLYQDDIAVVRALAGRNGNVKSRLVRLRSEKDIASTLGYQLELPTWMPVGVTLTSIDITQIPELDEVLIRYGDGDKSLSIQISCFNERKGTGASYEQSRRGKQVKLIGGKTIYLAANAQSAWGLYQSSHLDYFIDAVGFDEKVVISLFESMGGKHEKEQSILYWCYSSANRNR